MRPRPDPKRSDLDTGKTWFFNTGPKMIFDERAGGKGPGTGKVETNSKRGAEVGKLLKGLKILSELGRFARRSALEDVAISSDLHI